MGNNLRKQSLKCCQFLAGLWKGSCECLSGKEKYIKLNNPLKALATQHTIIRVAQLALTEQGKQKLL